MSSLEKIIVEEIKRLDILVDYYAYEDVHATERYMWMREALKKLLKKVKDESNKNRVHQD